MENFCMVLTILTFYMKLRPKMAQPSPDTVGGITPTIVGDGGRKRWCLNDTNIFKVSPWRSAIVSLKKQQKANQPSSQFSSCRGFSRGRATRRTANFQADFGQQPPRDTSCVFSFISSRSTRGVWNRHLSDSDANHKLKFSA